jgi:hypothetical protein
MPETSMPKGRKTRTSALLLSLAAFSLCRSAPARAFDTGHHTDMTRAAFQDEGFAPGSPVIGIAQVSNFLVDYFSVVEDRIGASPALAHLHFDNLKNTAQVRNAWARLAQNTQGAVRAAAAGVRSAPNETERYRRMVYLAVLIGASLHPVQDFYSHSNWVEQYPVQGAVYGTRTWFDTPSPSLSLRTGRVGSTLSPTGDSTRDHGGYAAGMNHDSYSRPDWPQAYVYGYSASRQWLRAIRQWVEEVQPALWQELLGFRLVPSDVAALKDDLESAYYVSSWTQSEEKNGAWKGRGSGALGFYQKALGRLIPSGYSIFVRSFFATAALARKMEAQDTNPGAPPSIPRVALGRRAVEVRTLSAAMQEVGVDFFKGRADLYAVVVIAGQRFVESTQQDREKIQPPWRSIAFVPASARVVQVHYRLFDEDGGLNGDPDPVDVHPAGGRTFAQFQFDVRLHELSGDLRGIHDSDKRAATLRGGGGDGDPATVRLYVTERALEEPGPAPRR